MKMKFNKEAINSFAKNIQGISHLVLGAVAGLSTWKGTAVGFAAGLLAWFVMQVGALTLKCLEQDEDNGSG